MWKLWLIISGLFLIMEIATIGFLVFWFAIGALFALVVSFFTDNIIIQTSVFIVSSTVLIFLTRPFVKKISKDDNVRTNAYSIIGKRGIVTQEINPISGEGQVKIGTETWSAKSYNDITIPEGTEIEVANIDGVKAIVK